MCFKSDLRIYLFCGDFECLLLLKTKNKNNLQVLIIVHNNAFIHICSISVWGMSWKCGTLIQEHACRHFEFCINKPELYRNKNMKILKHTVYIRNCEIKKEQGQESL